MKRNLSSDGKAKAAGHTPGPYWIVEGDDERGPIICAKGEDESQDIAYIGLELDHPEQAQANAALIAAAPELLEALKDLINACPNCGGSGREYETIEDNTACKTCQLAQEAIARAEGRANEGQQTCKCGTRISFDGSSGVEYEPCHECGEHLCPNCFDAVDVEAVGNKCPDCRKTE